MKNKQHERCARSTRENQPRTHDVTNGWMWRHQSKSPLERTVKIWNRYRRNDSRKLILFINSLLPTRQHCFEQHPDLQHCKSTPHLCCVYEIRSNRNNTSNNAKSFPFGYVPSYWREICHLLPSTVCPFVFRSVLFTQLIVTTVVALMTIVCARTAITLKSRMPICLTKLVGSHFCLRQTPRSKRLFYLSLVHEK